MTARILRWMGLSLVLLWPTVVLAHATTTALLRSFVALPLVTLKIVGAIHWEALRLWLKGARLVPRPAAASAKAATLQIGDGNQYGRLALPARAKALWSGGG